ncbi:MAG: pyruvate kinase [bacterium]|nr:pyruvate kinase [bacterium]
MNNFRHVKILATVGPASSDPVVLRDLIAAGVDAFRLNASHGKPDQLREWIPKLRAAEAEAGKHIAILLDLPGPKLRVGQLPNEGIELVVGAEIVFVPDGESGGIPAGDWSLLQQVKPGEPILLFDGRLQATTIKVEAKRITGKVVVGGHLISRKGINLPGTRFDLPDLLPQDIAALDAVASEVDWVALSFVRSPHAAQTLREALIARNSKAWIMAKVERPEAIEQLDEIIQAFDGIMVARGDLGVELPLEDVPRLQRRALAASLAAGKVAVTATEMLETMITEHRPTRAEASDVAGAVWQHTDAVMLSAETATGKHPALVVQTMARIIADAEQEIDTEILLRRRGGKSETEEAIARGAAWMALDLQAEAIVTPTASGLTAKRVARFRPRTKIIATSPNASVLRKLSLVSGVRCVAVLENSHPIESSLLAVTGLFGLSKNSQIVVTGGWPHGAGQTNFVQVRKL